MIDLKALYKAKKYSEIIATVNASVDPPLSDIGWRAEAYYLSGDFPNALTDYQRVIQSQSVDTSFKFFQRARTTVGKLGLARDEAEAFWESCSDEPSRQMGEIVHRVRNGESDGAVAAFRDEIGKIFSDPVTAQAWTSAFNLLVRGLSGEKLEPFRPTTPRKKIIVSGTGWSGSGAIFDHLREYPEIHTIVGEATAFEARGGFRSFISAATNAQTCIEHSTQFFFRNMLGFFPMRTPSCFKELRTARVNSTDADTALVYAEGASDVVRAIVQLIHSIGGAPETVTVNLHVLCDMICERMVTYTAPSDRTVLLDNCIHVRNISLARYLSNTLILCCFRDPRTNYVALRREFAGFNKTVEVFIEDTRKIRKGFSRQFDADLQVDLAAINSHVEVVAFENFVVSEDFRRRLAALANVNPDTRDQFAYFKPWVSFRNIQLHLDYEDLSEIRLIEQALPAYCVALSADPQQLPQPAARDQAPISV